MADEMMEMQEMPEQEIPTPTPVEQPDIQNDDNLAVKMDEEERRELAIKVVEEYDMDVRSRSGWDERRANWMKLFSGQRDPKNFPWPNCSNTHAPLLAVACLQFQARAAEALMPPKGIMIAVPMDTIAEDAAERVSKHMNWQLYHQMTEWFENMDLALLMLPINGSVYKKTWYDSIKKRNMSVTLGVDEFVTPYNCKRLADALRKTHVISNLSLNECKKRIKNKLWLDVDFDTTRPIEEVTPTPAYQAQRDKTNDESQPEVRTDTPVILEQHRFWDLDGDGIDEPCIATVDYNSQQLLRLTKRVYTDPISLEEQTMEFFTGYTFIPNPDSHYGFGFGHFLEKLNESATSILNQLTDSGTLSNMQGGFKTKGMNLRNQNMAFTPGEWKEIEIYGDDIRKSLFPLQYKEPSATLFNLLAKLQDYVKEVSTVSESMMGQLPPSDTKATTMLAVLEQGMKVFSSIHKRIHRALTEELKKLFILNRLYLNEIEYFYVQDSGSKEFQTLKIPKDDYNSVFDVIPVSDPNIMSRSEKLIKAEHVLQEVRQNPNTAQDPMAIYEATVQYFEALEVRNIDKIYPRPKPPEPNDRTPVEENARFITGVDSDVLPTQDDLEHLRVHMEFEETPYFEQITPDAKNIFTAHKFKHLAQQYQKDEEAAAQQNAQGIPMAPIGPVPAQVEYPEMYGGEGA